MRIDYLREFTLPLCLPPPHLFLPRSPLLSGPRRWTVNLPSVTVCVPIKYGRKKRGRDGWLDGWEEGGGRMQARRRASEVGGWLEESLCNSSVSPPSYICDVAPSLTLSSRLSHSVRYNIQSVFLLLSLSLSLFFNLPTPTFSLFHSLSLRLCLSANCLFQSFIGAATRRLSLSLSPCNCQISLLVQATPQQSSQPMAKQNPPPLQIHTHTHTPSNMHAHTNISNNACCRLRRRWGRKQLYATEVETKC